MNEFATAVALQEVPLEIVGVPLILQIAVRAGVAVEVAVEIRLHVLESKYIRVVR